MSPSDLRLYFLLLPYLASGFQLPLILPGAVLILFLKTAGRGEAAFWQASMCSEPCPKPTAWAWHSGPQSYVGDGQGWRVMLFPKRGEPKSSPFQAVC